MSGLAIGHAQRYGKHFNNNLYGARRVQLCGKLGSELQACRKCGNGTKVESAVFQGLWCPEPTKGPSSGRGLSKVWGFFPIMYLFTSGFWPTFGPVDWKSP